jgi:Spy/CpxP family protein refolding chaperone
MKRRTTAPALMGIVAAMSSLVAGNAAAQQPGVRPLAGQRGRFNSTGGTTIFSIVGTDVVKKELNVTNEQKAKLAALAEEFETARREIRATTSNLRNLDNEGRMKVFADMQSRTETLIADKRRVLVNILSIEQVSRLDQIDLQLKGSNALSDSNVQGKLNFTDEQKQKLETLRTEFSDKLRAIVGLRSRPDGEDYRKAMEQVQAVQSERDAATLSVLTPAQTEEFSAMKGKTFDVESLRKALSSGAGRSGRN